MPPYNLEAEQGLLASILMDNTVMHDVVTLVKPEDFYRESHQVLFSTMRHMYDSTEPIDLITLAELLSQKNLMEKIGGDDALMTIAESVAHAANAKYYAQIVREKAIIRSLISAASEILNESYSNNHIAKELIELAETSIFEISHTQSAGQTVELRDVITSTMDRVAQRSENRMPVTGVGAGYADLDEMTGGFQGSQLIILAARPSMGKTAFALNILDHVAINLGMPVLFFSLEMGQNELGERLLAARGRVEGHKLRTGHHLGTKEMAKIGEAYEVLRSAPVFIDDSPSRSVVQIAATSRRILSKEKCGLILIDYIQLIEQEDSRESRQEHIAKVSRRLKTLARELSVPVIALSQLNRGVETREDRRPRMADLRESGAIEQDADIILLLHRPDYYDPNDSPGVAEVIIAKNRSGATGTVKLTFLRNIMRFESLSSSDERFSGKAGGDQPYYGNGADSDAVF
jgi:replicative DNA helicase